jgi:hypothetical protein
MFLEEEGGRYYRAPSPRIRATETLVRGFMFRFQTKNTGRIPNVQSDQVEIAPCVYIMFSMIVAGMHFPDSPRNLVQKYDIG